MYGTFIMEITATELDRSGNRGQSVTTEVTIIVTVSNILFLLTTLSFISIIYLTFTSIDIVVMPVITNTPLLLRSVISINKQQVLSVLSVLAHVVTTITTH